MTSNGPAGSTGPAEIDTTKAHAARVYNYLLGGQANYEVDREAAERAYAAWPGGIEAVRADVREHRAALGRVVRYFVREAGITQLIDTGIPKENSVHEVAQREMPDSRVVYVALTHLASDLHSAELSETFNRLNAAMSESVTLRNRDEVVALLGGLDLVEPGVVQAARWRPDPGTAATESQMWCGVGRKPG